MTRTAETMVTGSQASGPGWSRTTARRFEVEPPPLGWSRRVCASPGSLRYSERIPGCNAAMPSDGRVCSLACRGEGAQSWCDQWRTRSSAGRGSSRDLRDSSTVARRRRRVPLRSRARRGSASRRCGSTVSSSLASEVGTFSPAGRPRRSGTSHWRASVISSTAPWTRCCPRSAAATARARSRAAHGGGGGSARSSRAWRRGPKRARAARRRSAAARCRRRRAMARPLLDRRPRLRPSAHRCADAPPARPARRDDQRQHSRIVSARTER